MDTRIKRFEMVELPVNVAAVGKFLFGPTPQLRNQADQIIVIKSIHIFPLTSYAVSQQTPTIPGLAVADIKKAVLTLYINGEESVKQIPLAMLINVNDFANPWQEYPFPFEDLQNVDFEKSYVTFSSAPTAICVIPFGINYVRMVPQANANTLIRQNNTQSWVSA